MVQVAAWFVVGVAWPLCVLALVSTVLLMTGAEADAQTISAWKRWTALWLLSSGVAVAATAVALGVGR